MPKRKPIGPLRVQLPKLPKMPEIRLFAVKPKGPKGLQALTRAPEVIESNQPPPMPANLVATLPEWYVYFWLTKHDIEFDFQSSMLGGRQELGGVVVDFLLPTMVPPMVINVMGLAFHYGAFAVPGKDERQKDQLLNMGYQYIATDEDDIMTRLDYVMRLAIQGIDISRGVWQR